MHGRPPSPMSHQSRGLFRCQRGARSRAHDFGSPLVWGKPAVASAALHFPTQRSAVPFQQGPTPDAHAVQPHHQFCGSANATSNSFLFVISFESRSGPGFHGRLGFVASWRPIYQNRSAIKLGGSPFKTLAEAEKACTTMLVHLIRDSDRRATSPV